VPKGLDRSKKKIKVGALIISNDDTAHNVISSGMTSEELGLRCIPIIN
jgi:hypothetical protein